MARSRYFLFLLLLLAILGGYSGIFAQEVEEIELEDLDFSQARLSFAGPAAFLLRDAMVGDNRVGFLLRLSGEGVWQIAEVFTSANEQLPTELILDFARFEVTNNGTLSIDGILWEGDTYATEITIAQDSTLGLPGFLNTGTFVGASLTRALEDADLFPGTQYREVVVERDRALDEISRLGERLQAMETKDQESQIQLSELIDERERLIRELAEAQASLDQLQEQNEFLADEVEELKAAAVAAIVPEPAIEPEPATELIPEAPSEIEERVAQLEEEIQGMTLRISQLEAAQEAVRAEVVADDNNSGRNPEISADIDQLLNQIRELQQANSLMVQEKTLIEAELRRIFAWEGYLAVVENDFVQERLVGFAGSSSAMGTWSRDNDRIAQTDKDQYFARLDLPLVQQNEALLYSFSARSTGVGWAGLGLHIYADKSIRQRGYGFGESLLVWLTRDPEVYGTDGTYLELYRSRDDVNMERVLHAAIEESLDETLKIEILYEPEEDFITLRVNGEEKIRYKTWFQVDAGVQVALRSLGTAEFSGLSVRGR